jgi:hypothetical protein
LKFSIYIFQFAIALSLLPSCSSSTDAPLTACIYTSGGGQPSKLILALWSDGRVAWSADDINGGPPLKCAKLKPAQLTALMRQLDAAFDPALKRRYAGDDAATTTIALRRGSAYEKLESWHELIEQNPRLMATARGISSLDAGTSAEVMMNQPAEYQQFRKTWSTLRTAIAESLPADGQPCDLPPDFEFPQ